MPRQETVIFALIKGNQILCERRYYKGEIRNCIPGGGVEEVDRSQESYTKVAAKREAEEELNVIAEDWQLLGDFELEEKRVYVLKTDKWAGETPAHNQDNGNELLWVDLAILIPSVVHPPLKAMLESLLTTDS